MIEANINTWYGQLFLRSAAHVQIDVSMLLNITIVILLLYVMEACLSVLAGVLGGVFFLQAVKGSFAALALYLDVLLVGGRVC